MNEEIKTHTQLVNEYNLATDYGGLCPRSFAEHLLEQIRLRDARIAELDALKWKCNDEMIKMADIIIDLERRKV
ncbi:MAG: hypothetical protein AUF65_01265 [Chloroflexi bacterium 13_1_20CM_50_12]|nr:MAG: hypothetical protein AUF65_01265 [Chloroflexi bacterium 13_1_20CM_50_12]